MLLMAIANVCIEYGMISKYYNHKDINYNIYIVLKESQYAIDGYVLNSLK